MQQHLTDVPILQLSCATLKVFYDNGEFSLILLVFIGYPLQRRRAL